MAQTLDSIIFDFSETQFIQLPCEVNDLPTIEENGRITIKPSLIQQLTSRAFYEMSYYLSPKQLESFQAIALDTEASENERYVASLLLKNAEISSMGIYPLCQDTGSAQIIMWKGSNVNSENEYDVISLGVSNAYLDNPLRSSMVVPQTFAKESISKDNLPAQIELFATSGDELKFLFVAKGGGSSNKTQLFQLTKADLNIDSFTMFLEKAIPALGAAACPPYHLSIVIGGISPEYNLKINKVASTGCLNNLPSTPLNSGDMFCCPEIEMLAMDIAKNCGIGAQFGGKSFILDAKVIRLPRHAASCHVSIGVSCVAHRNVRGKINKNGFFLEYLEKQPSRFLVSTLKNNSYIPHISLEQSNSDIIEALSSYKAGTLLTISGKIVVARDAAHAKFHEILKNSGKLPNYLLNHPIYYAGPAETPKGKIIGSLGPTTAQRMDLYTKELMSYGACKIMLAKGNRAESVSDAIKKYKGCYLGTIGGAAALLSYEYIISNQIIDYEELGMEAVRLIEVKNLPVFVLIDTNGTDFYSILQKKC